MYMAKTLKRGGKRTNRRHFKKSKLSRHSGKGRSNTKKAKMARHNRKMNRWGGKYKGKVENTNDFQNYYLEKYANHIFVGADAEKNPIKNIDKAIILDEDNDEIKNGSILWVIDMQNDFLDIPMQGLTGPPDFDPTKTNIGSFAVSDGATMVSDLIQFIKNNAEKFDKIIFTRDWHPPNHCSFGDGETIGTFPKHCVWDSLGADLIPKVKEIIEYKTEGNKFTIKGTEIEVDILFKGQHENTDSFTAVEWYGPQVEPPYPLKNRELSTCCSSIDCRKDTGGRKLKPLHISKSLDQMVDSVIKNNPKIKGDDRYNIFEDNYELPEPSKDGEIYVVGLAGEFCVKDTAIMLAIKFGKNKVNVIQDLTRYVFVPAFLPFQRRYLTNPNDARSSEYQDLLIKEGEWLRRVKSDKKEENNVTSSDESRFILNVNVFWKIPFKSLSLYMFKYNPLKPSETKRLELEELNKYEGQYVSHKENKDLFHFASDHRPLLKDYGHFGVKLWMPLPPPDAEEQDDSTDSKQPSVEISEITNQNRQVVPKQNRNIRSWRSQRRRSEELEKPVVANSTIPSWRSRRRRGGTN